ncbi:MAG: alpha/beta hydrolase, partial [Ignavibacteriaceae bacterium]|nr:alpha/beta hydrolase [Ignavibacteriaceae bacterium]
MKKCVLFIHGLGSNSKETWSDLLGKINTIKNNGDNYPKYRNYDFHVFDYSSEKTILKNFWKNLAKGVIKNLLSIDLEEDKISRIVGLLKTELEGNKYNIYNEIIVIAHSMGGVVLADYLLGLVRHNSMPIIKKILFLGTPFFGSAFASIASISGIATYETKLLKTNSEYLRNLLEDFEKYNFEDYFTCIYAFGTEDTIINPYYKSLRFSNTKWLRGDHSSMIQNQHLDNNYETIEKFIFDLPFYEKIISSNTLPIELCKNRPIEYEKIRENFYFGNSITDLLSAEDKEIYIQLYRAIDLHSFNPNQNYMGNDIYVEQKDNINSLENFYYQIKRNKSYPPFFYIGKPGSGKTLTQNVFLSRKYEDMQNDNNKIIHIRCDVHKIYDMIRGGYAKGIMIRNYLDIQFLYIFLKYRDKKYNNKKGRDNKIGITSKLMKTLDGILNVYKESRFDDDQNKDIFSGYENRFKNLGEFLEEQSKIIYHHEVDLRKDELPKRNNYSYALNVIMSGGDFKDSDDAGKNFIRKKSEAREYIRTIFLRNELENVDELLKSEQLKYFWMDSIDTEYMKSRIAEIIAHIYNLERSIEIKSNYFIIEIEDLLREQTAPKSKMANLWIKVSIQLQNIAKANGFRFLKMIDGIDNLVIRDNEREKKFYHDKIRELNSILEAEKIYEFYWITLRDDTFSYLQFENPKASYLIGDPLHDIVPIPYKYHHQFNKCLVEINDKRINYINRYFTKNNSLYKSIIEYVYAHNDRFKETIIFNNNLREILHNRQFMSLQIFFEFLRKGMSWDK